VNGVLDVDVCVGGGTTTALILARHFYLVRAHTQTRESGGAREGGREGVSIA
jgi:hypothetical protein